MSSGGSLQSLAKDREFLHLQHVGTHVAQVIPRLPNAQSKMALLKAKGALPKCTRARNSMAPTLSCHKPFIKNEKNMKLALEDLADVHVCRHCCGLLSARPCCVTCRKHDIARIIQVCTLACCPLQHIHRHVFCSCNSQCMSARL